MPDNTDLYETRYRASSVADNFLLEAVVDDVTVEEVGASKDRKEVLYFKGLPKSMALNATNRKALIRATGSKDSDSWKGCKVRVIKNPAINSPNGDNTGGLALIVLETPTKS